MKTFLSKKASASFYNGSNYTVVYHSSDIEMICKLQDKNNRTLGYAHIYLSFVGKGNAIIFANWEDFLCHLDSIKDMEHFASIMKRPCPLFYNLLTNEMSESLCVMKLPEYGIHVIGKELHHVDFTDDYDPMAIPFRKDIIQAVMDLSNVLLDLYKEIAKSCPLSLWKDRLSALWG